MLVMPCVSISYIPLQGCIRQNQDEAEVECNNSDIIQVANVISDLILENRPSCHIYQFEKC